MRIGIFFGGPSREREISFAGGRTVYDNLNKALFEPVPIFVDSMKNFILLDWQYVYKGTIRDFYPPAQFLPDNSEGFQFYLENLPDLSDDKLNEIISAVGRKLEPHEFSQYFDFAFLALHGEFGEDGQMQGLLEANGIPYSGSGILPSAIGMDKGFQKKALSPKEDYLIVTRRSWAMHGTDGLYEKVKQQFGDRYVIKPVHQGSSIGVSVMNAPDLATFAHALETAFFDLTIELDCWKDMSQEEKVAYIIELTDLRSSIGFQFYGDLYASSPSGVVANIDRWFADNDKPLVISTGDENEVLIERFLEGREFSCIVIRDLSGKPVALPPTEIVKGTEVYDYRSKYLPGLSRKITPIDLDDSLIEEIRKQCEELYQYFGFHVYARIDGFITPENEIHLNDPNTTSGMLPSSFFFHQAAEIGLNPSQFLTFIIYTSIAERAGQFNPVAKAPELMAQLEQSLMDERQEGKIKQKVAVVLGGYSSERHISVESGRNIYEKLASSDKYEPIPVFLTGSNEEHQLYQIPINILLKDNADDIKDKIDNYYSHPLVERIREQCISVTNYFADPSVSFAPKSITYADLAEMVDGVFIALHGRPGEDGAIQQQLEKYGLPYNGSGIESSQTTINKFDTLKILREHGFTTADQMLVNKLDNDPDFAKAAEQVMNTYPFPIIAKPVDDGCSSAVKKIKTKEELQAFFKLLFRDQEELDPTAADVLKLKLNEEFSIKKVALIETFIDNEGAQYFLEVTGGMLTHWDEDKQERVYEIFEPSETLATDGVLSLEEKFLAGEGQNITPARFGKGTEEYRIISERVKEDLEKAARILNVEGYCRIDAFVRVSADLSVETIIIEVNSLPGMTPATCIFHQAAINGYKPYDFINQILAYGFKKQTIGANG